MSESVLDIVALGREGDGIAHFEGATRIVPFALPGERVIPPASVAESPFPTIERASPERVTPDCTLFGECGGCAIQHLDRRAGLLWKADRVGDALRRAGFTVPEPVLFQTQPRTRRRIDLAIRRDGGAIVLGLHRKRGTPIDMTVCEILHPTLFALLDPLRALLRRLPGLSREASVALNLLDSGPDLLFRGAGTLDAPLRQALAAFSAEHGIPRIAWADTAGIETACQHRPVRHVLSGHAVSPGAAAFLQATEDGEAAIVAAVLDGVPAKLKPKARILDLYAGCGTLSFPLAERGKVFAYEGDAAAATALAAGAGGTRVVATKRDLVRQPLLANEIQPQDIVVLDPPFAGAAIQTARVAEARPTRVIYVSCNPDKLSEDAAQLARRGYTLEKVSVIDQFLWSSHVEAVAVFSAPAPVRSPTRR